MLEIDLQTKDWLNVCLFAGSDKFDCPREQVMLCKSDCRHAVFLCGEYELFRRKNSFLKRVGGVGGEVNVHSLYCTGFWGCSMLVWSQTSRIFSPGNLDLKFLSIAASFMLPNKLLSSCTILRIVRQRYEKSSLNNFEMDVLQSQYL